MEVLPQFCLGFRVNTTQRCRISWNLDARGFCQYHVRQRVQCHGELESGDRCPSTRDINRDGFCPAHAPRPEDLLHGVADLALGGEDSASDASVSDDDGDSESESDSESARDDSDIDSDDSDSASDNGSVDGDDDDANTDSSDDSGDDSTPSKDIGAASSTARKAKTGKTTV